MGVFRLMRLVHETPDRVTQNISEIVTERARAVEIARTRTQRTQPKLLMPSSQYRSPTTVDLGTFFMEFWNMKQRGELIADETPATWAVLMRAIDAEVALRILLEHCINITAERGSYLSAHPNEVALQLRVVLAIQDSYRGWAGGGLTPPFVSKLRTKLVEALREAAAVSRSTAAVLDPLDAGLLLSACETALVVKEEETRRWQATRP